MEWKNQKIASLLRVQLVEVWILDLHEDRLVHLDTIDFDGRREHHVYPDYLFVHGVVHRRHHLSLYHAYHHLYIQIEQPLMFGLCDRR